VTEKTGGKNEAKVELNLSAPVEDKVTVKYSTKNGTATAEDYKTTQGNFTFQPKQTKGIITIPIVCH
jgi:hypothetical protein